MLPGMGPAGCGAGLACLAEKPSYAQNDLLGIKLAGRGAWEMALGRESLYFLEELASGPGT